MKVSLRVITGEVDHFESGKTGWRSTWKRGVCVLMAGECLDKQRGIAGIGMVETTVESRLSKPNGTRAWLDKQKVRISGCKFIYLFIYFIYLFIFFFLL